MTRPSSAQWRVPHLPHVGTVTDTDACCSIYAGRLQVTHLIANPNKRRSHALKIVCAPLVPRGGPFFMRLRANSAMYLPNAPDCSMHELNWESMDPRSQLGGVFWGHAGRCNEARDWEYMSTRPYEVPRQCQFDWILPVLIKVAIPVILSVFAVAATKVGMTFTRMFYWGSITKLRAIFICTLNARHWFCVTTSARVSGPDRCNDFHAEALTNPGMGRTG